MNHKYPVSEIISLGAGVLPVDSSQWRLSLRLSSLRGSCLVQGDLPLLSYVAFIQWLVHSSQRPVRHDSVWDISEGASQLTFNFSISTVLLSLLLHKCFFPKSLSKKHPLVSKSVSKETQPMYGDQINDWSFTEEGTKDKSKFSSSIQLALLMLSHFNTISISWKRTKIWNGRLKNFFKTGLRKLGMDFSFLCCHFYLSWERISGLQFLPDNNVVIKL